ncbi:MAG: serine/threonine-protein kinase HipA [Akkermansiaceae bacterium]|jgi:serine/threonine-protein kinase HipA
MSKLLDVYLHQNLVGQLEQDRQGRISFRYTSSWLSSAEAAPLSQSLPLQEKSFSSRDCQGFFAGVLPEEENRKLIATILGVSANNDFSLLEQIGGECAGAVSFLPSGKSPIRDETSYQLLTEEELAETLRELPRRPLMAGKKDIRLSLAGAQNKLAVHVSDRGISLPLHHAPSTHILKPAPERFPELVANETFCLELAALSGLPTAPAIIGSAGGIAYLLMERYDRTHSTEGSLQRLHQEDFCQALGLPPHLKYQNEGGPSVAQSFQLLRKVSSAPAPDVIALLEALIFNFLIGNNDAHGKNFSLLYSGKNQTRLAPFYDLVSTTCYPELTDKMAMKIGSKYLPRDLRSRHWQTLWQEAELSETQARKRVLQFTDKVLGLAKSSTARGEIISTIKAQITFRASLLKKHL